MITTSTPMVVATSNVDITSGFVAKTWQRFLGQNVAKSDKTLPRSFSCGRVHGLLWLADDRGIPCPDV